MNNKKQSQINELGGCHSFNFLTQFISLISSFLKIVFPCPRFKTLRILDLDISSALYHTSTNLLNLKTKTRRSVFIGLLPLLLLAGCGGVEGTGGDLVEDTSDISSSTSALDEEAGIEGTGGDTEGGGIAGTGGTEDEGGIGGSGGPNPDIEGQALLGPVVEATVKIFNTDSINNAICTTKTEPRGTNKKPGEFVFNEECIENNKLYLLEVSGGEDIDVDDDGTLNEDDYDDNENGVIDGTSECVEINFDEDGNEITCQLDTYLGEDGPKKVEGIFRSLVKGEQLRNNRFKISSLTEFVFEAMQYSLIDNKSLEDIIATMDQIAPLMLSVDINGDSSIDSTDMILWDATNDAHGKTTLTPEKMIEFIRSIHDDKNRTISFILPYPELLKHLDTLSPIHHVVTERKYAYVASSNALLTISIDNPRRAKIVASYPTGPINDIAISNERAVIAGTFGLQVIDISNANENSLISFDDSIIATHIVIHKNLLFAQTDEQLISLSYQKTLETLDEIEVDSRRNNSKEPLVVSDSNIYFIDDIRGYAYYAVVPYDNNTGEMNDYSEKAAFGSFGSRTDSLEYSNRSYYITNHLIGNQKLTIHQDQAFTTSDDQETIDVFDLSDIHPYKIRTIELPCKHAYKGDTSTFVNDEVIVSTCRGSFYFWDRKSFTYLGSKTIEPLNFNESLILLETVDGSYSSKAYPGSNNYLSPRNIPDYLSMNDISLKTKLEIVKHGVLPSIKPYINSKLWAGGEWTLYDIDIDSGVAYIAFGTGGLQIVDFRNLNKPTAKTYSGHASLSDIEVIERNKYPWSQEPEFLYEPVITKQSKGGAIEGAIVELRIFNDINSHEDPPVCTTTSESKGINQIAGRIKFDKSCFSGEDNSNYIVTVIQGQNNDRDGNGIADFSKQKIAGSFHGIFTQDQMLNSNWEVNLLSEFNYQNRIQRSSYPGNGIPTILPSIKSSIVEGRGDTGKLVHAYYIENFSPDNFQIINDIIYANINTSMTLTFDKNTLDYIDRIPYITDEEIFVYDDLFLWKKPWSSISAKDMSATDDPFNKATYYDPDADKFALNITQTSDDSILIEYSDYTLRKVTPEKIIDQELSFFEEEQYLLKKHGLLEERAALHVDSENLIEIHTRILESDDIDITKEPYTEILEKNKAFLDQLGKDQGTVVATAIYPYYYDDYPRFDRYHFNDLEDSFSIFDLITIAYKLNSNKVISDYFFGTLHPQSARSMEMDEILGESYFAKHLETSIYVSPLDKSTEIENQRGEMPLGLEVADTHLSNGILSVWTIDRGNQAQAAIYNYQISLSSPPKLISVINTTGNQFPYSTSFSDCAFHERSFYFINSVRVESKNQRYLFEIDVLTGEETNRYELDGHATNLIVEDGKAYFIKNGIEMINLR